MPKATKLSHSLTLPSVGRKASDENESKRKSEADAPGNHLASESEDESSLEVGPGKALPGLNAFEILIGGQKAERSRSKDAHLRRAANSSSHLNSRDTSRRGSQQTIAAPQAMRGPQQLLRAASNALKLARVSLDRQRLEAEEIGASLPSLAQLAAGNFSLIDGQPAIGDSADVTMHRALGEERHAAAQSKDAAKLEPKTSSEQVSKHVELPLIHAKAEGSQKKHKNDKLEKKRRKALKASKKKAKDDSPSDEDVDGTREKTCRARLERRTTMQNLCKTQQAVRNAETKSMERLNRPRPTLESCDSKKLDSLAASIGVLSMKGSSEGRNTLSKLEKRLSLVARDAGVDDSPEKRRSASDSPTKGAGDDPEAETHTDKRLLMVRNARLIQQMLQEIPDEATRCHDKWLKKMAAKSQQVDVAGARAGPRSSTVEARIEQEVKKVGLKLRKYRRGEVLARLGRNTDGLPQASPSAGARRMETLSSLHGERTTEGFEEKLIERIVQESPVSDSDCSSVNSESGGSSSSSSQPSDSSSGLGCSSSESDSEGDTNRDQGAPKIPNGSDDSDYRVVVDGSRVGAVKPSPLADVVEVSGCGNLFFRHVTAYEDKPSQRLLTAPPGLRKKRMFSFDEKPEPELDLVSKAKGVTERPGTTPGCLQQWLDISSVFQEVLRQRELVRLAALDLERALESKKLEPLAKLEVAPVLVEGEEALPARVVTKLKLTAKAKKKKKSVVRVKSPHSSENASSSSSDSSSPRSHKHAAKQSGNGYTSSSDLAAVASTGASRKFRKTLSEVPRLRSRYHDHTKILHDEWKVRAQTIKRYHLEAAERLGLEEEDWKSRDIYQMSVQDLVHVAEVKEQNRVHRAALRVQVQWRLLLWVRKVAHERKKKRNAILLLQRFWHRRWAFIHPINKRCAYRPVIRNARALIGAVVLGWWVRKKIRFRRDCHGVKWQLSLLQQQLGLGRKDVDRFVRAQAHIRGFLARRKVREMMMNQRKAAATIAAAALDEQPLRAQSPDSPPSKAPGSRRVSMVSEASLKSLTDVTKRRRGTILGIVGLCDRRNSMLSQGRRVSRISMASNTSAQVISQASSLIDITSADPPGPIQAPLPAPPPPPPPVDPKAPIATLAMYKQKPAFTTHPVVPLSAQRRRPGQNFLIGKLGGLRPEAPFFAKKAHRRSPRKDVPEDLAQWAKNNDIDLEDSYKDEELENGWKSGQKLLDKAGF